MGANVRSHLKHLKHGGAGGQGALGPALDGGAIGDGIGKGHAKLDDVGTAALEGEHQRNRAIRVRIAGGDIGHQAFAFLLAKVVKPGGN